MYLYHVCDWFFNPKAVGEHEPSGANSCFARKLTTSSYYYLLRHLSHASVTAATRLELDPEQTLVRISPNYACANHRKCSEVKDNSGRQQIYLLIASSAWSYLRTTSTRPRSSCCLMGLLAPKKAPELYQASKSVALQQRLDWKPMSPVVTQWDSLAAPVRNSIAKI